MKLLLRKGFQKLLCNFCWYPIRKKKKLVTRSHKDEREFGKCNLYPGKQNAKLKKKIRDMKKKYPNLKTKEENILMKDGKIREEKLENS